MFHVVCPAMPKPINQPTNKLNVKERRLNSDYFYAKAKLKSKKNTETKTKHKKHKT